jgi:hypothetical protein
MSDKQSQRPHEEVARQVSEDIDWEELIVLEPRLLRLQREAQALRQQSHGSFDALAAWYGKGSVEGLKERVRELVGWRVAYHGDLRLAASSAYDLAYDRIFAALTGEGSEGTRKKRRRQNTAVGKRRRTQCRDLGEPT